MYGADYFLGNTYLDYIQDQPIIELNARNRLDKIHRYVQPPGLAIDIGCAAGFFLNVCRQVGWEVKGVELSDYAAAFARKQLNLDVHTGTLATAKYRTGLAKLVTLWDVIEHVPDPKQLLAEATSVLKPGGLLVLSTGDIESRVSRLFKSSWRLITYDHLYYFSAQTIQRYLEDVGLEVLEVRYPGRFVSPRLTIHMLFIHYLKGRVFKWLKDPLMSLTSLIPNLNLNFGDVMTVYARKPSSER